MAVTMLESGNSTTSTPDLRSLRRLTAALEEIARIDPEMPLSRARVLLIAMLDDGSRTGTDICRELEISTSSASRALQNLGNETNAYKTAPGAGLVEARVNPQNRKERLIFLTPSGRLARRAIIDRLGG